MTRVILLENWNVSQLPVNWHLSKCQPKISIFFTYGKKFLLDYHLVRNYCSFALLKSVKSWYFPNVFAGKNSQHSFNTSNKSWFLPKISAINTKYSLCQLTRLYTAFPIQIFYFETFCTLFQNCLRDSKLVSNTFSAEQLMKVDTDKLEDKYDSSHQVWQPTAKYPVTTD